VEVLAQAGHLIRKSRGSHPIRKKYKNRKSHKDRRLDN